MRIILASRSPRRRDILNNISLEFEVVESSFQEAIDVTMCPEELVKHLAYKKAEDVANNITGDDALVIGADTIVVHDGIVMGKPKSDQESFDMLKRLSGDWHNVYTGICVIDTATGKKALDFDSTSVKIRELSDEDIKCYINTGEPIDKAGSYAIQGIGSLLVEKMEGCYFNVVGLPIYKLSVLLKEFGIDLLRL